MRWLRLDGNGMFASWETVIGVGGVGGDVWSPCAAWESVPIFTSQVPPGPEQSGFGVTARATITGVHDVRTDVAKTSGSPSTDIRLRRLRRFRLVGDSVGVRESLGTFCTTSDGQKNGRPEQYQDQTDHTAHEEFASAGVGHECHGGGSYHHARNELGQGSYHDVVRVNEELGLAGPVCRYRHTQPGGVGAVDGRAGIAGDEVIALWRAG